MKKYQLLLLILLFIVNTLQITASLANSNPASFRNIKKLVDNISKKEPTPASFKNIKESRVSKTKLHPSKIREITTEVIENAVKDYMGQLLYTLGRKGLHRYNYSPIAFIGAAVIWYPGTNDIYKTVLEDSKKYSRKELFIKMAIRISFNVVRASLLAY